MSPPTGTKDEQTCDGDRDEEGGGVVPNNQHISYINHAYSNNVSTTDIMQTAMLSAVDGLKYH